jgi:hypothetical protein
MKNLMKFLFLIIGLSSFKAEAALPFALSAARGAFHASRFAFTHGVPAARIAFQATKPIFQAAKPHLLKAVQIAKANPQGALVLGGAAFGAYNAKEGFMHTTIGAGLGAAAFLFPWSRAFQARQALALADAKVAIAALVPEVAGLRTKLSATQQGYAVALERLKDAAKPVVEKAGMGLGVNNSPLNSSVVDKLKSLLAAAKSSLSPEFVSPALFGAA